ncbi:serine hydrolase, partial [Patescibacteria group bacterium]|nr:serine hydrolase [Patescibacteria group bacterium]MBU1891110.1 serine hydrolase [Patescibacteria group bacterium]
MKKTLVTLISFLGIAFFIQTAQAEILTERAIHLDEPTIQCGYTIPDREMVFNVGILPNVLSESAWVKVRKLGVDDFEIPTNKRLVSDIYQYDIRVPNPTVLEKPIALSMQYDSADTQIEFKFYNRVTSLWQTIPAVNDTQNRLVKTLIHFPFAQVAVFAELVDQPSITSEAAIVVDKETGEVLYEKNSDTVRSIASLTKLMTALVFLDNNPGWETVVELQSDDMTYGAKLYASVGETLTTQDLFNTMMIGSANNAARALARSTGLSEEEFVAQMNQKAISLGMADTTFTDPTGLDVTNQSTAQDLIKLTNKALSNFLISQTSTSVAYNFSMINTGRYHHIKNTNLLVQESDLYLLGGKTGYLDEAGYC